MGWSVGFGCTSLNQHLVYGLYAADTSYSVPHNAAIGDHVNGAKGGRFGSLTTSAPNHPQLHTRREDANRKPGVSDSDRMNART